jgi:dihydrofolate reductase
MKVTLVMAMTLDGKIGISPDHFPDWTGTEDKRLFAEISKKAGVVIMGSRTFDTLPNPLPGRKNVVLTRNRERVPAADNVIFTDQQPGEILAELEAQGHTEAILAGGALVNALFALEGRIDEIVVTVSPRVFGHGLSLFAEEVAMDLALLSVEQIGTDLVCLRYKVKNGAAG